MVEELVDFIISKDLIRIGDPVNLGRLYKEIVGKRLVHGTFWM